MYPPLSFTPLKAMLLASLDNITFAEIGVFMLFFLVFTFCFFLSLIFWGFRRILFVFFLIETGILLGIPYGISAVSQKIIYPIEVRYDKFRPFVYTTGFNYDIEITSKAKLPLKKCFLTIIPKREGANILPKPKNLALLDSNQADSSQIDSTQADSLQADSQTDSSQIDSNDKKSSQDNEQSNQTNEQSSQAQNQDFANKQKESNDSSEAKSSQEPQEKPTIESQEESNAEQKQDAKSSPTKPTEQNTQKPPKQPKPPSQYALKAYKILDYIIPLDAFVEVLELESPLKYNKKVRWQGIIRDYKYDENFGAQVSCH
ncbi:DUF2393 family protein [Helicobacter macacae]|uniref:Uncharacterized protein n=1 Tax=Helicobacter macacae MIT 99-5501 TaxID=1357400 RepID=V8C7D1_9HELI|nr:DUF2393 family protein [Helicobacter macacae]ETD23323.1 hypothetical protein HMPREF2086_01122 [Helicobacter macacae MIT 99-5501]